MRRVGDRSLVVWSCLVLALLAAHDVTHILDEGLETPLGRLALVALPQWVALAILTAILVRGERGTRHTAALLLGIAVAVGFALIHLLPFSAAAYWDVQPSVVSWALAWLPAAAGLLLAVLAWRAHGAAPRRRGGDRPR
jgi:hypothetical protein